MFRYNHVVIKQAICACRKLLFVYTNFPQMICTCSVLTAQTLVCPTLFVHTHICACPNKAAQSYHCSHMHLASNYYVVIKLAFFAQTTCVRQTSGKLTATPLVIIFEKKFLTCVHSIYKNMGKCSRR